MYSIKKLLLLTLVFSSMFYIAGCSLFKTDQDNSALTIGILSNLDAIPLIVAKEQGLLEKNVELSLFSSAQERDSAFQSGALDGIMADVLAACFNYSNAGNVAITGLTDGKFVLVASPSSGIESISDLNGKTVAISENTIIEFTLDQMLDKIGGVTVEKMPMAKISQRLEMLNQGLVDAALFPEPFASSAALDGAVILQSADELGLISGVMIFDESALTNKNEAVSKFYKSYNKAVDYINNTSKEKYIDIIMQELAFPENLRDHILLPSYRHVEAPPQELIQSAVEWLLNKELINENISYEQIVRKIE